MPICILSLKVDSEIKFNRMRRNFEQLKQILAKKDHTCLTMNSSYSAINEINQLRRWSLQPVMRFEHFYFFVFSSVLSIYKHLLMSTLAHLLIDPFIWILHMYEMIKYAVKIICDRFSKYFSNNKKQIVNESAANKFRFNMQ